MRPLLVGENNPYSSDPDDALVPYPVGCAGWRLCVKILGMNEDHYLAAFDRTNLLSADRWSAPAARDAARRLLDARRAPIIALGSKVAGAFGLEFRPFDHDHGLAAAGAPTVYMLPHPSGRCRLWLEPDAVLKARRLVAMVMAATAET
jgi:hypothetical protein